MRDAAPLPPDLARLAKQREPVRAADCPDCSGTGEGSTEYTRCTNRRCRGKGWLTPIERDDD